MQITNLKLIGRVGRYYVHSRGFKADREVASFIISIKSNPFDHSGRLGYIKARIENKEVVFDGVFVDDNFREKGIFTSLMFFFFLKLCSDLGQNKIKTTVQRKPLVNYLLSEMGFTPTKPKRNNKFMFFGFSDNKEILIRFHNDKISDDFFRGKIARNNPYKKVSIKSKNSHYYWNTSFELSDIKQSRLKDRTFKVQITNPSIF